MIARILLLSFCVILTTQAYFCVEMQPANPGNTFVSDLPCKNVGAQEVFVASQMSEKMLFYQITVDYSMLRNVPRVDYKDIINKPTVLNGIDGQDGKDCNWAILWVLIAWCCILTLIIIALIVFIFTKLYSNGKTRVSPQQKSMITVTQASESEVYGMDISQKK